MKLYIITIARGSFGADYKLKVQEVNIAKETKRLYYSAHMHSNFKKSRLDRIITTPSMTVRYNSERHIMTTDRDKIAFYKAMLINNQFAEYDKFRDHFVKEHESLLDLRASQYDDYTEKV